MLKPNAVRALTPPFSTPQPPSASFKTGATYPCQFVFKKPFTDTARMKTLWLELVAEIGMDPDMCTLVEQSEVPKPFPAESGPIEADHCKGPSGIDKAPSFHPLRAPVATVIRFMTALDRCVSM